MKILSLYQPPVPVNDENSRDESRSIKGLAGGRARAVGTVPAVGSPDPHKADPATERPHKKPGPPSS